MTAKKWSPVCFALNSLGNDSKDGAWGPNRSRAVLSSAFWNPSAPDMANIASNVRHLFQGSRLLPPNLGGSKVNFFSAG